MFDKRQEPSLPKLGLGTIAGFIVILVTLIIVLLVPFLFGLAASVILFIPEQLSLVKHVSTDDIIGIVAPGEYDIQLPRSGQYIILTDSEKLPVYEITLSSPSQRAEIVAEHTPDYVPGADGYFIPPMKATYLPTSSACLSQAPTGFRFSTCI